MEWYSYTIVFVVLTLYSVERYRYHRLRKRLQNEKSDSQIQQLTQSLSSAKSQIEKITKEREEFENYTASAFKFIKENWELAEMEKYKGLIDPKRSAILDVLKAHYPDHLVYSFVDEKIYRIH